MQYMLLRVKTIKNKTRTHTKLHREPQRHTEIKKPVENINRLSSKSKLLQFNTSISCNYQSFS